MEIDLSRLSEPIPIENIDFRIATTNKKGYCTILAYKDARVDMKRLDDVAGPMNWKREHSRDNRNCTVSIWNEERKEWISKEDTGTESNTEKEKGLASDSFKRACFNWGIGRELYDFPRIGLQLSSTEFKEEGNRVKTFAYPNSWKWEGEYKDGKLVWLTAKDKTGIRFSFGKDTVTVKPIKPVEKKKPYITSKSIDGLISLIKAGEIIAVDAEEAIKKASDKYSVSAVSKKEITDKFNDNIF